MATFEYDAKTRGGARTRGLIAAADRSAAAGILQKQDLFVVRLRSEGESRTRPPSRPQATRSEIAWQMWQLSMMVETGLGLTDALQCLARQAKRQPLRALLDDVAKQVREGASLSAAMGAHPSVFPASLVSLIKASELSGAFKDVMRKASQYLLSDLKAVRRFKGALAYPAVLLAICFAVTVFLLTVILPKFAGVFAANNAPLPLPTRILMGISEGVTAHWLACAAALTGLAAAVAMWKRSPGGKRQIDRFLVTAPLVSPMFNALFQSRAFTAMSLMLQTHVPLLDAIRVAHSVTPNHLYQQLWKDIEEQVRVGEPLSIPLRDAPFIPDSVAQVIDNGDRSGKLSLVFTHLAEFFDEEYKRTLTVTMQLIEPCLIVAMGSIIGFVAVALMLPLIQASQMAR